MSSFTIHSGKKLSNTSSLVHKFGIDDEFVPEDEVEFESEDEKYSKKRKQSKDSKKFYLKFDDGKLDSEESEDESDSENDFKPFSDKEKDNLRTMPRAIERAERATKKKANLAKNAEKSKSKTPEEDTDNEENEHQEDVDLDHDSGEGMDRETELAYFDEVVESSVSSGGHEPLSFSQLSLSRPLLRAVEASGYTSPTPVQAKVIPLALSGRDVCASAVTGSGKTAAFVLPFLERLLYRSKSQAAVHVLIVTPTRELATQIHAVVVKLSMFLPEITSALICGGKKDLKSQEVLLRNRPDIVVCTPGRIIDHLRNSRSVSLDDLDILILDEVDRLLDLGFQEEVEELLKHCPENRQTLLFSATMTAKVEDLAKLSLKRPIRVKTERNTRETASRLVQEFVKVRKVEDCEAMLLSLVCRSFHERTIVFYETKKEAHRFYLLLTLVGIRACELHGNMTQSMRDQSFKDFKDGRADVMVATDVASRGLDIQGVRAVLNAQMPRNASTYVHRVGRTARAGCAGRAVTLVSDDRRKVLKEIMKGGTGGPNSSSSSTTTKDDSQTEEDMEALSSLSAQASQMLNRTISPSVITEYTLKIASLEKHLIQQEQEERETKKLEEAERDANRAENLLLHEDEIHSRPARTWYQTEIQKTQTKDKAREKVKEEQSIAKFGRDLTASEKMVSMARRDDYRDEKMDEKKIMALTKGGEEGKQINEKMHRESRKKRRRKEVLQAMEEDKDREGRPLKFGAEKAKSIVKTEQQLKKEREEKAAGSVGLGSDSMSRVKNPQGKWKIVRQKFAVGGLDFDEGSGSSGGVDIAKRGGTKLKKKLERESFELENFKEFDPNKRLRKGGKKTGFKSKKKFKRR